MTSTPFLCSYCSGELNFIESSLICHDCGEHLADLEDDLVVFKDITDKFHFFEMKIANILKEMYTDYKRKDFIKDLAVRDLWEIDDQSKKVGLTRKFWWENHIGKIEKKKCLKSVAAQPIWSHCGWKPRTNSLRLIFVKIASC